MNVGTLCMRRRSGIRSRNIFSGKKKEPGREAAEKSEVSGRSGSRKTRGKMSLRKFELEELNQTLQEALREAMAEKCRLYEENTRLQEAFESVCTQLVNQRKRCAQQRMQYQKLTDYVKRLHAWANEKGKSLKKQTEN